MIIIEKNIPIPYAPNYGLTAQLRTLEVGDSILWPSKKTNGVHAAANQIGLKVIAKKYGEGIRIWRVA